jgi:hypothetical protein
MIKNTDGQVIHFSLVNKSTAAAVTTGTVSPYITLDGGAQAAGAGGAPTHEGNGQWSYTPTQAETNADSIGFLFIHPLAVPTNLQVYTVSAAVEEAIAAASAVNPPLTAHMTTLEAVNQMLRSIGEQPVSSLSSGQIDAELAQDILDETSRRIQGQGWHANTRRGVEYTLNASNQFAVGVNVLSIDTVNSDSPRRSASPTPSAFYNVMMKRAADDSKFLLYDVDNDTETWASGPSTLVCDVVEFLVFDTLPPLLQVYIYKAAAHEFQKSAVSSEVLRGFSLEDVQEAQLNAIQEDAANEDRNMIRNHRPAWEVAYRYNPLYNT